MDFKLNPLPYAHDALEPFIDKTTMEIHHGKHHQAYTTNLNKALVELGASSSSIEYILENISKYSTAIRNNAGGYYNHNLFWKILSPNGGTPDGVLLDAIHTAFGSLDNLKATFSKVAATRFGSGWAWLIVKEDKQLAVCSTPNQDNPLMDIAEEKGQPILGIDVWEHAYYLKYQNRRPDYIEAFWNIVNWEVVGDMYLKVR